MREFFSRSLMTQTANYWTRESFSRSQMA